MKLKEKSVGLYFFFFNANTGEIQIASFIHLNFNAHNSQIKNSHTKLTGNIRMHNFILNLLMMKKGNCSACCYGHWPCFIFLPIRQVRVKLGQLFWFENENKKTENSTREQRIAGKAPIQWQVHRTVPEQCKCSASFCYFSSFSFRLFSNKEWMNECFCFHFYFWFWWSCKKQKTIIISFSTEVYC